MLSGQGVEIATEFAQCCFGVADAQLTRLLERGERVINARDGLFIGVDVEVTNSMVDELGAD